MYNIHKEADMVHSFTYHNDTKVYFGKDALSHLEEEIQNYGTRVLLVYGGGSIKKSGLYDTLSRTLRQSSELYAEISGVKPNPELDLVEEGIRLCRENRLNLIIAAGGGSVIDTAKAIAGSVFYQESPWELITARAQISHALPVFAIPTMAASGSEMNGCAVISNSKTCEKYGWTTDALRPKISFIDPAFTFTVSPYQTACGAADILSHILEVYLNQEEGFDAIDGFMESMMRSVIRWAPIAMKEPDNEEARANLLWNSEWAINDLIDCGHSVAWSCHGMEHELSAYLGIPHGHGLAILTPVFMKYVLNKKTAPRLAAFAVNVMGVKPEKSLKKTAKKGIRRLSDFFTEGLNLTPGFSQFIGERESSWLERKFIEKFEGIDIHRLSREEREGMMEEVIDEFIAKMADHAISWKGKDGIIEGFVPLSREDLINIYNRAF